MAGGGGHFAPKWTREEKTAAVLKVVRDRLTRKEVAEQTQIGLATLDKEIAAWRRNNPKAAQAYALGDTSQPPEYFLKLEEDAKPDRTDLRARMAGAIGQLLDMVESETESMVGDIAGAKQGGKKADLARLEKIAKIQKLCADLVKAWADMDRKPSEQPQSPIAALAADLPPESEAA